ncbi:MAG: hypothetical protein CL508_05210 [Actinobacteria bacterium]|nr:hypothetical protein [Actinomycetota bacterium]MBO71696.1 hypothetical protein [Actinomycetota bacterium]|tara:strand:+ start:21796 stop:22227 length:432 start_codon:yes stop_codon:yes gene_type:complete
MTKKEKTKKHDDLFQTYRTVYTSGSRSWRITKVRGNNSLFYDEESEGKTRYIIGNFDDSGKFIPLGVLKQYESVEQFKALMEVSPSPFNRKALKPLANGQMSPTFMKLISGDGIAKEFAGQVPTKKQCKAYMNAKFKGSPLDY